MGIVNIGLVVSAVTVGILAILFSHEMRRGVRFAESFRMRADSLIVRSSMFCVHGLKKIQQDIVRQSIHYLFHIVCATILSLIKASELLMRRIMYTNKNLAHIVKRSGTERSKLDEIVQHKLDTALTEEERHAHKEKSLNGE